MRTNNRKLLLGAAAAVLMCCVAAAVGQDAELPPVVPAPEAATAAPPPPTAPHTTRATVAPSPASEPNRSANRLVKRTRLVSTTALPRGTSLATEARTRKKTTTSTTPSPTTTTTPSPTSITTPSPTTRTMPSPTTRTMPSPTTITASSPTTSTTPPPPTTSSPYSIYDARYYMDEEALARESSSSSAAASRQFPSYEARTGSWRHFAGELTTPSVPYFDKMHSSVVSGIEHSIDQVLTSHKRKDKNSSERAPEDNTVEPSHYLSSKPSDVRLDFSNRVEIVFNGTKGPASVRRDLVVINGTHIDLEINRTTVYPIDEYSTVSYYELTTSPQEVHQPLQSDNKEFIITRPVTTTDIPGTTDATTNIPRSHVDSSFSANNVQNKITTVSPGEINSTTHFIIYETTKSDFTTELLDVVPTTEASLGLKDNKSQKPTNVSGVQSTVPPVSEPESTENVNDDSITTTVEYEPSSTTSRRPPWVPLQSDATTTDLPEINTVSSPRSSRGRMMSSKTSSANRLGASDAEGSGSVVELLTTESPEENTVYPLHNSSPSIFDNRNMSPNTRRKTYTFKITPHTTSTTVSSSTMPSTSSKSPEDNIITAERSATLNSGSEITNNSAQNNEKNDISNVYSFPPVTSRGTIKYVSKAMNNTDEATSARPTTITWSVTALKGRGQRLRNPLNISTTSTTDDEQETSYVRIPTVEKPKNSSQRLSGLETNRTTTRLHFTPLGPTRIRTITEDDRNSSEWPNSFSNVYVFPSTTFPPSYNTISYLGQRKKEITSNKTSVAAVVPNNTSSFKFTLAYQTSTEEVSTEITTPLFGDVTLSTVTDVQNRNFSASPSTPVTSIRTILFPTSVRVFPTTTTTYTTTTSTTTTTTTSVPSVVTLAPTIESDPVVTTSTTRMAPMTKHPEATESIVTTTQVPNTVLSQANDTTIELVNTTRTNTTSETKPLGDAQPEAGVHSGSVNEESHPNGSKPASEEDPRHGEGILSEEEPVPHGDGNQLPDVNHHSHDRGPNRGEGVHEDTLPTLDDPDYGGGSNDLETTVAGNTTTTVDTAGATVKKDRVMPTSSSPVHSNTTANTSEATVTPKENVSAYLLLLTDASWHEVCQTSDAFRAAVATSLSQASNKVVQSEQVILLNVSPALCSDVMLKSDGSEKQLVPIEFFLTNSNNEFDLQMCQEFRNTWMNHHLEYPYPVRSVELVLTTNVVPNTTAVVSEDNNTGTIAAIVISCVGIVSLVLLAVLVFVLMRKRQKRFNYGQRCTPVSLDAYSLDSVSVCNSVRRKALRASKRSFGNPAFDDPNAPSHPINFAGLANFSSDVSALEEEFAMIPQLSPKVDEVPQGAESKNRYANVIPLPETRVTLARVGGDLLSEYINANYVRGQKGAEKFYIACQAPLQSTVTDFWRMVWEHQSKVILMLTDLVEDGKEKCADYLPPSEVTDCHRLFGDFQITLKKREVKDKYIISSLQIKNLETNLWREVTHLWYLGWPAQGVPEDATSLIAFLIEARSYTRANTGPIVAHCSPGTGRTGTVLACDLCIREFEQTRMVDIPRCVYRLRRDRAGAVQTKDQYVFVYQVLNIYATKLTGGALDSL